MPRKLGFKTSEETKKLISEKLKGHGFSDVTIKKMSDVKKGKKQSSETIEKRRLKMIGHSVSEDTRKKIGKRIEGENNGNWSGGSIRHPKTQIKLAGRPRPEICEICGAFGNGAKLRICFDHDHTTGKFRGWICTRCNAALGMVKDNVEILQTMINYLLKE